MQYVGTDDPLKETDFKSELDELDARYMVEVDDLDPKQSALTAEEFKQSDLHKLQSELVTNYINVLEEKPVILSLFQIM